MKVSRPKFKQQKGFSLVELLVVMVIIAIIAGMASFKMRSARPIDAAQMFSGLTDLARVEAMRNGATTRIAIQDDLTDEDTHLRKVVVVVAIDDDDNPSTDPVWRIVSMKELPLGTLLDTEFSGAFSGDDQEMSIDIEDLSSNSGNSGMNFLYHQFDSVGQCESSFQWVFTSGIVQNGGITGANETDLDGFIIRKTGQSTFFSKPSQITTPTDS